MLPAITIEEAQANLKELLGKLSPGDEVVITNNHQPVAKLIATAAPQRQPRRPGTLRGSVLYMAADFNAPLDDFKEYMQ